MESTTLIVLLGMLIAIGIGWIKNLLWLLEQAMVWNIEQIISIIGVVVVPLGALMGYMH